MSLTPKELSRRLPLALFVGWLVPGGAHWCIGHRRRAVFLAAVLLTTFGAGFAMGGFRNVTLEHNRIAFAAQAGMAGPCLIAWGVGARIPAPASPPGLLSLGTLYTAVASLLNMMCVLDVFERVARANLPEAPADAPAKDKDKG